MKKILGGGLFLAAGLAGALVFLAAGSAHATVAVELGGPELASLSDVIVHARVVTLSGHVSLNPMRVFTDADLQVIESVKGATAGEVLHVSYPGGVHNGIGMYVSGQVTLAPDQECVIYLRRSSEGTLIPSAMRQGYLAVQRREYDGVRVGVKNTSGLALLQRNGSVQRLNETPKLLVRPLAQLMDEIRADMKISEHLEPNAIVGGR